MRILFLSDNFPPEVNAPATRTHEHCRLWVQRGHEVTVVTCAPNFPRGKVFDGYRNALWHVERVDGIRVIRVWTFIAANEGFMLRVLDYFSYMFSATVASLFVGRVDVVVATSPQFFTACAGWVVSVLKRIPFVFELRDIWPESIKAVGAMRDSAAVRILERVEMFLYRRATRIVSVTHSFRRRLGARGIDTSRIDVITNGADLSRFSPRPKDAELERQLGLEGCFVAGYVGTHGMAHGLDTLVEAAERLQNLPEASTIRILMLGDGAAKGLLKQRAAALGLRNIIFVDTVPKDQVVRWWSVLDVSIIHLKRTELFSTVIPSKLFECMAMGIPVLHGVSGESAEIVEREAVGQLFESENAGQLVEALLSLVADGSRLRTWQANAISAARRYERSALADQMLGSIEAAVVSRRSGQS